MREKKESLILNNPESDDLNGSDLKYALMKLRNTGKILLFHFLRKLHNS